MYSKRDREFRPYQEALSTKVKIIEIFVSALCLGLSLTFISTFITQKISNLTLLIIGIILFVIGIFWIYMEFLKKNPDQVFSGFFLYDIESNRLIPSPHYEYSEHLSSYLKSAFLEDPDLKKRWEEEPLKNIKLGFQKNMSENFISILELGSMEIIRHATEFFLITELSQSIKNYEMSEDFEQITYESNCLDNIFISIFCKPIKNRPVFASYDAKYIDSTYSVFSPQGHLYKKLDIILPKNSKLYKNNDGIINLETPKFTMEMEVKFYGNNTLLPFHFAPYYLNVHNESKYEVFHIEISIQVCLNLRAYVSNRHTNDFEWLDSFIKNLNVNFDKDKYFNSINWSTIATLLEMKNQKLL
ncbi:hypothetical protein SDA22_00175 [Legionella pneumophila serogroup 1]|uniref:hypothetical protein n=1 Tax=Legionella pneumophila TaxID=446 RepID=UPI0007709336|nr:hypothetical protein [Legionella pneumophila]QIB23913.1 hypothetical protein GCO85_05750 [Legionella pneumophila]CZG20671.1 Uncharacterised protein [Legionella pneumophila]